MLVSLAGGVIGLAGGVAILHVLSAWQPIPDIPINVPVNPDIRTYAVALLLALFSGLLFGMVPVRQVMRADPWQMIRTGMSSGDRDAAIHDARRAAGGADRDLRGAGDVVAGGSARAGAFAAQQLRIRSAERDAAGNCDLHMAGYTDDRVPQMQRRMLDAVAAIPGVTAVGYIEQPPAEPRRRRLLCLYRQHH